MRVFVTDLHTTLGTTIARYLQDADHEVLGTVPSKSHLSQVKRKIQAHPSSDREDAVKDPVAVHTDKVSTTQLLQKADVVVATGLAVDIKATMELLKQYEKAAVAAGDDEEDTNAGGIRRFVAISSILTWSKNAVYANAKDQRGHSEDDFKTRKPARRYAELKTAETQILSANKPDEFETCVVAAGLIYGGTQSSLTPLFRNAWMYPDRELLVPALPGSSAAKHGENLLPMVSVYDLALLASRLAVTVSIPKNYIIATDKPSQSTTLRDVCVGLSVLLGNGKIRDELTEDEVEAMLVSEDDADAEGGSGVLAALQLHLCFDGASETSVTTSLVPIEEYKHLSTGLLSNLAFYVEDFITSMDLRPLKTLVLGPPRVGKTTLCDLLAKDYYLPHITVESIADEILASIGVGGDGHQENGDSTSAAAEAKPEVETPGGITSDEDDPELQQLRVELLAWRATSDETKTASADELPEATIVALLRWKLATAKCRNQGFVLDGMPVSVEQASKIFEIVGQRENGNVGEDGGDADADAKAEPPLENPGDDAGGDGEEDAEPKSGSLSKSRSKAILDKLRPKKQIQFPNRVIVLQAPQVLLEQRAQTLSDEEAIATGNTQRQFATRYALFSGEAESLATFFEQKSSGAIDGVEVLEVHLDSEASYSDSDVFLMPVKKYMEQGGGKPHNFHPTREEIKQMERDFARKKQDEEDRVRQQELDQKDRDQAVQHARMEAERARLEIIQREEAELLEARAKPLRTYLMDTVLPALTEGMLEIVKVQPDDPIDYLAEFLFKKGRDLETNES